MEAKGTLFILSILWCSINANGGGAAKSSHIIIHWEIHSPRSKWKSNNSFSFRRHYEGANANNWKSLYFVLYVP